MSEEEKTYTITITWEDDECDYEPSVIDVAAYNFTKTSHWYVKGFILLLIIGNIASLFE